MEVLEFLGSHVNGEDRSLREENPACVHLPPAAGVLWGPTGGAPAAQRRDAATQQPFPR